VDAGENRELLEYFHDRRVWLVEADEISPRVSPYSGPTMKLIYSARLRFRSHVEQGAILRRHFEELGRRDAIPDLSEGVSRA